MNCELRVTGTNVDLRKTNTGNNGNQSKHLALGAPFTKKNQREDDCEERRGGANNLMKLQIQNQIKNMSPQKLDIWTLTGTVTSRSDALLTTMFIVYSMLKRRSTMVSPALRCGVILWKKDHEVLWVVSVPPRSGPCRRRSIDAPIVPQNACKAVSV